MKIIPLSQGLVALVSDQDYEFLSQWKWYAAKSGGGYYARRMDHKTGKLIYMHRVITNAPPGMVPDHINYNTLDNRRENLRLLTSLQNLQNPSPYKKKAISDKRLIAGYRGIRHFEGRYWRAQIHIGNKSIHLGSFSTAEAAARAFDAAAKKYGKDIPLNFPEG
jgi:hypothetical protein